MGADSTPDLAGFTGWVLRGWEVERGLRRSSSLTGSPRCWLERLQTRRRRSPEPMIGTSLTAAHRPCRTSQTGPLRDQRDEPAIGRGVALLQALYAGLAGRRGGPAEACSVACRRALLGLSALSLATVPMLDPRVSSAEVPSALADARAPVPSRSLRKRAALAVG
jgi:hypothetical protein